MPKRKTKLLEWKKYHPWTKTDKARLRRLYPTTRTYTVAYLLERPYDAVKKQASRMGIKKSKRYMKSLGRA